MAFDVFTVAAKMDADASGVGRGVNEAEGHFGKLGGIAKVAGAAVVAGLAVAAGAAVKLGVDAIGAASDLEETRNKARVVFGDMSMFVESWAEDSAKNYGISESASLAAMTSIGDMFSQLGQSRSEAAGTSQQVLQLAADLGSFNNLGTDETLDKITAAFRGEYDSLQALIPNINAARVEKEALATTGKELAKDLTAEEKAMATLAIITNDGAKAQGDFARTSDSLSNQQKILGAQFEDVKAKIGEKLLPVATKLFQWANDEMLPAAEKLGKWLEQNLGPILLRVGEFIADDVVPAAQRLFHWFMEEIAPGIRDTLAPILEGLRDLFDKVATKIEENEPELRKLLEAFKEIVEFIAQKVMPVVGNLIGKGFEALGTAIGIVIDVVAELVGWIDSAIGKIQDLVDWISKIDIPDIDLPGLPRILSGATSALPGSSSEILTTGGKFDRQAPVQVIVQGALDPDAVGQQVVRILERSGAIRGVSYVSN